MKNVQRFDVADYINITPNGDTETYTLMGTGFTKADEDPGAQTTSKTYINEKSATTTLTSYESKFSYDMDLIADEQAVMFLYNVGRDRKTGEDATTDYIRVDLYDPTETTNEYKARKFKVTVEADTTEGDGGEQITSGGSLDVIGDPVFGTFNTTTKKFTADTAESVTA